MKDRIFAVFACLLMSTTSVAAMQCSRAHSKLERTLCSDTRLAAADKAMAKAYFHLLHAIDDPSIRASLIQSQRRWLAARENDLGHLDEDGKIDERTQRDILLRATRKRSENLKARSRTSGQPQFIVDALKQRALATPYSGGPFAGYQAWCTFIPRQHDHRSYSYSCFGSHALQNGRRVCSESNDFASYTEVTTRVVADVENDQLRPVASCAFGGSDNTCPSDSDDKAPPWNRHPTEQQFQDGYAKGPRLELDPDLPDDSDETWYRRCLTEPSYPQSAASSTSGEKPTGDHS